MFARFGGSRLDNESGDTFVRMLDGLKSVYRLNDRSLLILVLYHGDRLFTLGSEAHAWWASLAASEEARDNKLTWGLVRARLLHDFPAMHQDADKKRFALDHPLVSFGGLAITKALRARVIAFEKARIPLELRALLDSCVAMFKEQPIAHMQMKGWSELPLNDFLMNLDQLLADNPNTIYDPLVRLPQPEDKDLDAFLRALAFERAPTGGDTDEE